MIHRRQFILGNKAVKMEEFYSIRLKNNLFLSYHKDLLVTKNDKEDEDDIYILGNAFQTDPNRESPIIEIRKSYSSIQC